MWKAVAVAAVAAFCCRATPTFAVIVIGDQSNTTAPTGTLAGSGWDFEGTYGDFLGTPIAPNWFITAAHFNTPSSFFTSTDGVVHNVINTVAITGTDLSLRQVAEPFSAYASIYNPTTDGVLPTNAPIVVFGRGTDKGTAIAGRGWNWGADNHTKSYGTNTIDGLAAISQSDVDHGTNAGFAAGTTFLVASFDNNGSPTEGTLSNGDSGGGVFVNTASGWKLVGINYGVDLYSNSATGPDVLAAIYDARGLYEDQGGGVFTPVSADPLINPAAVPQAWFSSYVPNSLGFITATVPEPGSAAVLGVVGPLLLRRRRQRHRTS